MMKLKTISVALLLVSLGAYGASLAAFQAERAKSPPVAQRGLARDCGEMEIQGTAPCS